MGCVYVCVAENPHDKPDAEAIGSRYVCAETESERPHPACPDGESDGQLAHLRKGSQPPRCHVGEADLLAKRLSAALANRLIHHPGKLGGVSCDLCRTTRAGASGYDENKTYLKSRLAAALFQAIETSAVGRYTGQDRMVASSVMLSVWSADWFGSLEGALCCERSGGRRAVTGRESDSGGIDSIRGFRPSPNPSPQCCRIYAVTLPKARADNVAGRGAVSRPCG
jgi:hypothetical protein